MNIELLSIDFWNTLYHTDSKSSQKRRELRFSALQELLDPSQKTSISLDDIQKAYLATNKKFEVIWKDQQATAKTEKRIATVLDLLGVNLTSHQLEHLIYECEWSLLDCPPSPAPFALNVIEKLVAKGYKLAITSDTAWSSGEVLQEQMKQDGLLDYFDYLSFSDETGYAKPHPLAFSHFEKGFNGTWAHIGDLEDTDVIGAINRGGTAILYEGQSKGSEHTQAHYRINNWNELLDILT